VGLAALVMMPWVGGYITIAFDLLLMMAPISITGELCIFFTERMVRGIPMWLFQIALGGKGDIGGGQDVCTSSLVVVFPLLPVMAMKGILNCFL